MLSRRDFLAGCALAAVPEARRVPVIDTHVHCFAGREDRRFPYHKEAPYRPEEKATPQALLRAMTAAGVDHAVIVHPEPYQDDHRYLEYCLAEGGKRFKGTCLFFAGRADNERRLRDLVKRCALVALRIHAYAPERLPPFGKPALRALWKMAADAGLVVQLHFEPRHASGFEPYLREFAKTPVLIDHLGRPFQGTPAEHKVVVGWSRFANVHMKLSSLPEPERYPHRKIAPVIRQLADAYGPGRLLYGGGWNAAATARSYRAARERLAEYLAHLPAADLARVQGGNAARLFRFEV